MALKFCPNCGTKIDGDQNFCANCGYNLTNIPSEQNDETASNNESQQETQEYLIDVRFPAPFPIDGSGKMGRD